MSSTNFNTLMKEYMANMPDNIDSKKECDEYYKTGCKEIKEKLKDVKKADKIVDKNNEEPKKRVKKVKVDEEGNEIEKVKKLPNAYNKYIQEQRPNVKNDFPNLNNKEIFAKIAEMWKNHKDDIKKNSYNDNSDGYKTAEDKTIEDNTDDDEKEDAKEDAKEDDKDDAKEDDKEDAKEDDKEDDKKTVNKKEKVGKKEKIKKEK